MSEMIRRSELDIFDFNEAQLFFAAVPQSKPRSQYRLFYGGIESLKS
jgi:hypothetical protein